MKKYNEKYEKLSCISRLCRLVFHGRRRTIYNKVVIHFDDGDWETTAINGIIYVPWWARKLKMKLEDDGTVTLADKYFAGYGKQYGKTTWEYVK